jgi:hypothetical protein
MYVLVENRLKATIHGNTRQQVGRLFATVEQPALRPLPAMLFPVFEEARRRVAQSLTGQAGDGSASSARLST